MKLTKVIFLTTFLLTMAMSEDVVKSTKSTKGIEINFKDLEIEDFIKMVAKITNKNILLTTDIRGKINFVSVKPIAKDKLYELLIQILETKGFTIIETKAGFLNLVRTSDVGKENLPIRGDGVEDSGTSLPQMVTEIIRVKSENVDIVTSKIRHLLSKSAKLVTSKEINSLILSEYPENIATVKKIINRLENTPKTDIRFIEIKHEKAATILGDISKIATTLFNQQVDEEKIQILKNDPTNSLIVIGKKKNIDELIPYIEKLDTEEDKVTAQKVEIIPLRNSETKDVLAVVNTVVGKKIYAQGEIRPTITADNSLNAIVAMGVEKDLEEIKELVNRLDRERQQVYVKAKIIEISDNKLNEFGMKYGILTTPFLSGSTLFSLQTLLGDGSNLIGSAIEATKAIPGFDVSNILQEKTKTEYVQTTVTDTLDNGATSQYTTTKPQTVTYTAAPDFGLAVSLSLLDASGATNKLSEPSILCINNEESSIYVGETRRINTGSVVGTTTQNLTKVEDIGLTLKIKPRLSNDKKVTLTVSAKLEDTIPGSNQNGTTKREVATKAIVRNGESVIIGGLIRDSIKGGETKVPLLGDIPVIGDALFKHTSKTVDKINLVIILTPYIIDTSADLTEFKNQLATLNRIESDYAQNVMRILGIEKDEEKESMESSSEDKKESLDIITPSFED